MPTNGVKEQNRGILRREHIEAGHPHDDHRMRTNTLEWKEKDIYTVEYFLAIKKNAFESVLMRRMKLEPIKQSEVSQKDKHQYSMLMHIYGI